MDHVITLGSFVFFTALVGVLTWLMTRKDRHDTSSGYFLGGRSLTAGFIAGSLLLTNLSTEQLVGLNADAFTDGLSVMAWEVIAGMSLVVMALFFLPRYLRSGISTIPQFLEERFDHRARAITSLIFIVAYAGILLPIVLYTGATGVAEILDMRSLTGIESRVTVLWLTVWLIGIIGSIYAIFGGLRTVAVSDTLNGFGLLVGGIMITWLGLQAVNPAGPIAAIETLKHAEPEKFNSLGSPDQTVPFSTLFTGVLLLNLFYWCTNQQIIQRAFGASTLREGQKGVLIAGALKILAPLILVLPGIIAFHQYGHIEVGDSRRVVEEVTLNGEVSFLVSEGGEEKFIHGHDIASLFDGAPAEDGTTLEGQQLTLRGTTTTVTVVQALQPGSVFTRDEQGRLSSITVDDPANFLSRRRNKNAYGTLVRNTLPKPLTGFFAAVIVGAILSSFNSALNSTATLFSLGVYQKMIRPDATEQQVIASGKLFGWLIAVTSMTVAPLLDGQDSIFNYLQKMNGLYFIPIFSVVLVGIIARRVPSIAASVGLIAGFLAIVAGYFCPGIKDLIGSNGGQLHTFHFLGVVFASLVVLMLVIGKVAPRETPWEHKDSGVVDLTPWKPAVPF
ncbi:MAG: solute:sodium symporter family transporter, partial [Planctomycetaceae bacterium]|nr:solute:sodium symporter family transporter [Planctomycetaceae bacterium]